ncbi:MAG: Crp/Fnr family transcriptional regulator [Bacteroidota bacterium]
MNELIEKLKSNIALSTEAEEYLISISTVKEYSKGEIVIRQGDPITKVLFVLDGCLRSFCTDKTGKDHTLLFAIKDWWISDYIAIHSEEPASLSVECLNDSRLIAFNSRKLMESLSLFPEFQPFQRKLLERHMVSLHKRILNHLQLSASERYDLFLKQYPDIEQFTSNYHIASYLGIAKESLSRIRAKKAEN